MLIAYAHKCVLLQELLKRMEGLLGTLSGKAYQEIQQDLQSAEENDGVGLPKLLDSILANAEELCADLNLKMSLRRTRQIRSDCTDGVSARKVADLRESVKDLNRTVIEELEDIRFLFVPSERISYWSETPLFSEKVQRRYKRAFDDMVEAGKCLAVGRYTACVFHLMRVVEIGAKRLAKNVGLAPSHKAPLGTIARDISKEVVKMPTTTPKESDRKEAFSKTVDHLAHITAGWRNKTMHPGLSYNEEEATLMFKNVCSFVNLMVELH